MHPKQTIMSNFCLFNPEHEIALASNLMNFTAPKAGRMLRADLGFLPVFWAEEGDVILVDDVDSCQNALDDFLSDCAWWLKTADKHLPHVVWTDGRRMDRIPLPSSIDPWGWDPAVWNRLSRIAIDKALLPSLHHIEQIRLLAHRRTAARLLAQLSGTGIVGEAFECHTMKEVEALVARYKRVMIKAPWSSSGRGVRPFTPDKLLEAPQKKWIENLLHQQESVMVEPYYNKVKDFAMEFTMTHDGQVRYEGLSLFHTDHTAYTGNLLAT